MRITCFVIFMRLAILTYLFIIVELFEHTIEGPHVSILLIWLVKKKVVSLTHKLFEKFLFEVVIMTYFYTELKKTFDQKLQQDKLCLSMKLQRCIMQS